ncbi:MAG TPA: ADOP family duplicated permease [Gemmatimonadaceae bacterium]|nr:ADOP family duplicated permease [Gemmatimonadaceae bacterium]
MLPPRVRRLFRLAVHRRALLAREVDDEIAFHLEARVAQLVSRGMAPEAARAEALRRFGNVEVARLTLHRSARRREARMRSHELLAALGQDVRYAARGMRKHPAFSAAVVLTLALGIGANATMFDVVDRLLLRPPAHLRAPDEVHRVYLTTTNDGFGVSLGSNQSYRRYLDLAQYAHSATRVAAHYEAEMVFGSGESARQERTAMVSASFWPLFGARPALGRFFGTAEDQLPRGAPVAVLGYGYWQSHFAGARDVLGKHLRIGSADYTVIGVAPPRFSGLSLQPVAAFIPLTAGGADLFGEFRLREPWYDSYHVGWLETVVRRKPGVSVEAATADVAQAFRRSLEAQRLREPPGQMPGLDSLRPRVVLGSVIQDRGPNRSREATVAVWLQGVSALVLLMACANVANLLVARAIRRRREIAIRVAVGVSRGRLLAQLLSESVLLALAGGVAGVLVAQWGGGVLRAVLLPDLEWGTALFDPRVLLFAAAMALAAGLVTGLAPLRQIASADVVSSLRAGGRGASLRGSPLRRALLVVQAAVSVVLLVGAGLFVRSFHNVRSLDLGFQPEHVLAVEVTARGTPLDSARRERLMERLRERARAVPGVVHAAATLTIPFSIEWTQPVVVPGIDTTRLRDLFYIDPVGPDYFATMGTRIVRGRAIGDADRAGTEPVAVLSQSAAQRIWPRRDALGNCVKLRSDAPCHTVVGIAQDIRPDFSHGPAAQVYLPLVQEPAPDSRLFVRTRGDAAGRAEAVRRALQELMPGAAFVSARPLEEIVAPSLRAWRLGATMFTIFGLLALVVAAIGLYSVVAHDVSQRVQELGVRVALGASTGAVLRLVVGEGLRVVAVGLVLGTAGALALANRVAPLLFDVPGNDPITYTGVVVVLLAVAVVASLAPAMRAARVDPNVALRAE